MKNKSTLFMMIALVAIVLISGCGQQAQPTTQQEVPIEQVQQEPPAETELFGCDAFSDKLDACEEFSCEFEHPSTGETMEKKITELSNGKCQHTEGIPNNRKINCEYSESLRKAIAQYYKDLESGETEAIYVIDDKEVENPFQEAMDSGVCTVLATN
tara:strand:+ start:24021 stop:24491 length:471 start_codon:yes stop_codon:yes gene_type:complete